MDNCPTKPLIVQPVPALKGVFINKTHNPELLLFAALMKSFLPSANSPSQPSQSSQAIQLTSDSQVYNKRMTNMSLLRQNQVTNQNESRPQQRQQTPRQGHNHQWEINSHDEQSTAQVRQARIDYTKEGMWVEKRANIDRREIERKSDNEASSIIWGRPHT